MGTSIYCLSKDTVINYIKSDTTNSVQYEASKLNLLLNNFAKDLTSIANTQEVKSMDIELQMEFLKKQLKKTPGIKGFSITNSDGNVLSTQGAKANVLGAEEFQRVMKGETLITKPRLTKGKEKNSILPVQVPIYNEKEVVVGRLAAEIDTFFIGEYLDEISKGKQGYSFITDKDFNIIGTSKEKIDFAQNPKNLISETTSEIWLNQLENSKTEEVGYFEMNSEDAEQSVAYSKMTSTDWLLFTVTPRTFIMNTFNTMRTTIMLNIIAGVCIATLLVLLLSKYLNNYILKLTTFAQKLGDNELIHRLDVTTTDELGILATDLNKAVSNINTTIKHAKKIEVKSRELINLTNVKINSVNNLIASTTDGIQEISANMEESSASIEEITEQTNLAKQSSILMNDTAKKNISKALKINDAALKVIQHSKTSQLKYAAKINQTKEKLDSALQNTKALSNISTMAENINKIAKQTNMLSLNASIEASKFGDSGKGFTVVAKEIKKLSNESAVIAATIQNKLEEVTNSMLVLTETSKETFTTITDSLDETSKEISSITNQFEQSGEVTLEMSTTIQKETDKIVSVIENLFENSKTLTETINRVTANSNVISEDTLNISNDIVELTKEMNTNIEILNNLEKMLAKFKTD